MGTPPPGPLLDEEVPIRQRTRREPAVIARLTGAGVSSCSAQCDRTVAAQGLSDRIGTMGAVSCAGGTSRRKRANV